MTPDEFASLLESNMERMKAELPQAWAEAARDEFVKNFDEQGFFGDAWAAPQEPTGDWPILVKTGTLKDAVQNSIKDVSWEEVRLEVDSDYGAYHNDGTERLPQREFAGESEELDRKLEEIGVKMIEEILR